VWPSSIIHTHIHTHTHKQTHKHTNTHTHTPTHTHARRSHSAWSGPEPPESRHYSTWGGGFLGFAYAVPLTAWFYVGVEALPMACQDAVQVRLAWPCLAVRAL
jgi:hypothetical protein